MPAMRFVVSLLLIAMPAAVCAQRGGNQGGSTQGASNQGASTQGKGIRLWNLTASTISAFQLSPAGKNEWGPNQTLNDKDKEVDHDERLRITGIAPGRYDARVGYPDARQCFVRDIEIKADAVFSIADQDLTDCNK